MNIDTSPSITTIVKPTYDCNLGCLYCYEGGRTQPLQQMNLDTLRNVITKLACYHGKEHPTRIIWHGGEPLLMGLDFFRSAVQIQQDIGSDYKFDNSIQTNSTLLTDEILDFFQNNDFSIGTSLDGPRHIHDFTRPYIDGQSNFEDIMRAVSRMRQRKMKGSQHSIGGGVIAIMTKPLLSRLDEFYEFFSSNHINLKINPIFYAGRGASVRKELGITPVEYGNAMIYLFDRWFYEAERVIDIDPFDLILGNMITSHPWGCQFSPACYDEFIAVDFQGNVFPCGRWSDSEQFRLGNLNMQDMIEIRQSPVLEQFRQGRAQAVRQCRNCEFFSICNSGCVENAFLVRERLSDRDIYCGGYKKIFKHLQIALLAELNKACISHLDSPSDNIVTIHDKSIDVSKVVNPALNSIIKRRISDSSVDPVNWNDHKKWSEVQPYKVHSRYDDYTKYSKHNEHMQTYTERWNQKYQDHYDHSETYYDH